MAQTGNQATLTFTGSSGAIVSISIGDQTVEMLDKSVLSDQDWMKKLVADLIDGGQVTVTVQMATDTDLPVPKTSGSLVITFPIDADIAGATPANLTGTAVVVGRKYPDFENNTIAVSTTTYEWDGATPPAFTGQTT